MYNLPIDSTINDCDIFHEGNHDNRGIPHDQFVCKIPICHFSTGSSYANKYIKIATIKVLPNSNLTFFYRLKVYEVGAMNEHTIDINFPYTIASSSIKHTGDSSIVFYGITSTATDSSGNTLNVIDIYAKPTSTWKNYFFALNIARGLARSDLGYDDFYAYRSVTLLDNQSFVSSITPNIIESVDRPRIVTSVSSSATTVSASSDYKMFLTVSGLTTSCVVSIIPNLEIPSEFQFSYMIAGNSSLEIKFTNKATYSKDIPACIWNIEYKSLV